MITGVEWSVETVVADVATLHGLGAPNPAIRTIRWCVATKPAIVLGSTQPDSDVDAEKAHGMGLDVVRRRSGGGAVLVEAADSLWVDVFVPSDDPLWTVDVNGAFYWLGDAWANVLQLLGTEQAEAYKGPLVSSDWSRTVCFAGLGPGEVTAGGKKLVGISQRRNREGALFQCSVYRDFNTERVLSLLTLDEAQQANAAEYIRATVSAIDNYNEAILKKTFLNALTSI